MTLKMLRALALLLLAVAFRAGASDWPDKPVRFVVPYGPGAMGDVVSRLLAEELRPKLGQPVLVENRPGAGGNIGTAAVARAEPDGLTVLVGATNNFVINQYLYHGMGFDPLQALEPVTILVDVPSVIFIPAALPVKTFDDFVRYAQAHKGKLNYGSPGAGTTPHLSAALINRTRDLGMTHVPYKGSAPGIQALLADQVQFYMGGAGLGAGHVKAGKLRALAISGAQRSKALPDTPTFEEAGLGDIKASNYWAVAVPKGTPAPIVQKLYEGFHAALQAPEAKARFAKLGVVPVDTTPAETARRFQEEAAFWAKAVREMHVQIE